ncbi:MAG: sodium-dependent bicarbonate transport family permease [Gemmatimonadaceae bacterium]
MSEILRANLLSPIALAFGLGVIAKLIQSDFKVPKDLYNALAIYLLLALGLKGGVELSHSSIAEIARPALATIALGCITPLSAYFALRKLGGFDASNAAGIAAHYGSVSAVTFIAAQQFVAGRGLVVEGFMPTLLTLLESPGIHIALALGAVQRFRTTQPAIATIPIGVTNAGDVMLGAPLDDVVPHVPPGSLKKVLHEVLTGQTMILLVGGLMVGYLMGDTGWKSVSPFFDTGFKGALTLFLLEMGMVAGSRLGDLKQMGPFLLAFAILTPIVHGVLGVVLGNIAGLSVGGATILGTMSASASYIAAPPAVRVTLPDANPTFSLTAALAVTFPFNLLIGIPLYFRVALAVAGG